LVLPVLPPQQQCQLRQRGGGIRIQRERAAVRTFRGFEIARSAQRIAEVQMRTKMVGLARDYLAKILDGGFGRPHFELDRAETVAQRDMLGVDRECSLVTLDRLVPPSAVSQYIAEIAEIERVAGGARHGPTQQPDRVIE